MRSINQVPGSCRVIILFAAFIFACSSIPVLKVNYSLPPFSDDLRGREAFLEILDFRDPKVFLDKEAEKELENFPGNISFSIARHEEPGFKIGYYSPVSMFKEAIKRRLENEGLKILPQRSPDMPELQILLKRFLVQLVDRKWVVKMEYEAQLRKKEKKVASQTIIGQSERFKFVGRSQVDDAIEEIFSDMVNRLDTRMLFKEWDRWSLR